MADFIKGLILEMLGDFTREWWWLSIPVLAVLSFKFVKKIPANAKVVIALVACTLGGYLIGLRKPPEVRNVEKVVERRVEIPTIVEKRVEVPTIVEKIKEVFVKPSAYGNCIDCGASFHLDGATGQVKCPRCGRVQQAKSAADMSDTLIANKNAEIERLSRGLVDAANERERQWQAQALKYDAKCPWCGHLFRFPKEMSQVICGNCHEMIWLANSRKAWDVYRAGTWMTSQTADKPPIPYTEKAMAKIVATEKANAESVEEEKRQAILPCPGCKSPLQFDPRNFDKAVYCRKCYRNISKFDAQHPRYFKK